MYIVVLLSYILGWVSWTEIIGGDCGGHGPFIVVRAEPEGDEGYAVVWRIRHTSTKQSPNSALLVGVCQLPLEAHDEVIVRLSASHGAYICSS